MEATTPSPVGEGQSTSAPEEAHETPRSAADLLGDALDVDAPPSIKTSSEGPAPDAIDANQPGPDGVPIPKAALDLLQHAGALESPQEGGSTSESVSGEGGVFGVAPTDDVRSVPKSAVALRIELEFGRHDSAMAYRALEDLGAIGYMARAVAAAKRRDLPVARRDRDAALAAAPRDARLHLIAGVLSAPLREYDRALSELREAADLGLAPRASLFATDLCRRLTWRHELRQWIERGTAADPARRRHYLLMLIQLYEETELREEALAAARELHETYADEHAAPTTRDERLYSLLRIARLAAMAGHIGEAEESIQAAISRATPDRLPEIHIVAAEVLSAGGAFEKAEALLQSLLEVEPTSAVAAGLARLALARRDHAVAEAFARRALALDGDCASALRTCAECELRKGNSAEATKHLDRILTLDPADVEASAWRRQAAALGKASADTGLDADWQSLGTFTLAAQVMLLMHDSVVAQLPRVLATLARKSTGVLLARWARASTVKALPPRREPTSDAGDPRLIELVCAEIRASYGDRISAAPVGHHVILPRPTPEEDSRRALHSLCVLTPEEVATRLDHVIAAYPESGFPIAAMGLLYVGLGETKKARGYLDRAAQKIPVPTEAQAGLATCALMDGSFQEAASITGARGVRGETLRRAGRLDQARLELQAAVDQNKYDISSWLNLGLLAADCNDDAGLARSFNEARERAPTLISDAAARLNIAAWLADDSFPSSSDQKGVLEQALKMLRGSRSADVLSYFLEDGRMRTITPTARPSFAEDTQDIAACEALVDGFLRGGALELI